MDYTEYIATVKAVIMGKEITFTIPYLEEEYDEEDIYQIAFELIPESIWFESCSIKPMESEVHYD